MRAPVIWRILAVLVAVLPAAGSALDWSARVGADYMRTDSWATGQERLTTPRLDLDLGLNASGFLYEPRVFDWHASARYQQTTTSGDELGTTRKNLDFRGGAAIFSKPGSPLRLDFFAERATSDYSVEGPGGEAKSSTLTLGGAARLVLRDRPTLSVSYTRIDQGSTGDLFVDADRTLQSVSASTTVGPGPYSATAVYAGVYSNGQYASDNYNEHRASIDARAVIDKVASAQFSDSYYLRIPTVSSAVNPRQELNSFSGIVALQGDGLNYQHVNYRYTHALQTEGATADTERANQRLEYVNNAILNPQWRLRTRANVSVEQDRVGSTEELSTGETLGANAYWNQKQDARTLELNLGPSFSLLQPANRENRAGYGANAGVTWSQRFMPYTVNAHYGAAYSSDLNAVEGWALSQQASLSADRNLAGATLSGLARAQASAFNNPLIGPSASRQLELGGRLSKGTYSGSVRYLLASNVHGGLNDSLSGDGLFIPPGFDSHTQSVIFNASATAYRHLAVHADLRFTNKSIPDRPTYNEVEARGQIDWGYGALRIGIEDRYIWSETPGGSLSRNLLMLKFFRAFGSRD